MGLEVVEHSEHSRLPTLKLPNRSQRSSLLQSELAARTGNSYFRLLAKRDPSSMFINAPGRALHWVPDDYVICADEKTSIQARRRKQPTLPAAPIVPRTSSISTSAWGPGPIWQAGMSIEQESSAAVKSKVELLPWIGLWAKSWVGFLTQF